MPQNPHMRFAPAKPFLMPIAAFTVVIILGALFLLLPPFRNEPVGWVDALFVATSAVSVTGLAPFDVFEVFNEGGQIVLLLLMQMGGVGILTLTTLAVFLIGRRVELSDRIAVEQSLFYDARFNLKKFLSRIVCMVLLIESAGAVCVWLSLPAEKSIFNSIFLSVSAFCNAGFAPWGDSLERFRTAWGLNITIMVLIVLGGLGFFVLDEMTRKLFGGKNVRLSFYSRIVLDTTFKLVLVGACLIFLLGCLNPAFGDFSISDRICSAFFESITSRTAGFATVNQAQFSRTSLLLVIFLMMIGGSPGSCAGGIKTTTFRVLGSFLAANFRGRPQAVSLGRAFPRKVVKKALLLLACSLHIVFAASFIILMLEHGLSPMEDENPFFDIFFEVVSAFCTVGLSINYTVELCEGSKLVLCVLMFTGKVGPIWLLAALTELHKPVAFRYPEENVPVG